MAVPQLEDLLAEAIPKGVKLNVRHVSTTPTRCEAIFSAPPGQEPETTYCESHFLIVTLNKNETAVNDEIAVFGVEVYIYTTDRLTTIFVAKADSTGYLHLLKNAAGATTAPKTSLLRLLTTTFLSWLTQAYQRPGVRLVLSLFARAQNQYLFPGSIDNKGKHVLDDRGLIKWWCRAADPILRKHAAESQQQQQQSDNKKTLLDGNVESVKSSATAYLLVPGCDQYETRAFFPLSSKSDDNKIHPRWRASYPVSQICGHPHAPPRCLVPRFPDDPKARFLIDLDDELSENAADSKTHNPGQWRSVKSLDQFWEMMSFRQECSAGRLVGFLWLVINPPGLLNSDKLVSEDAKAEALEKKEAKDSSTNEDIKPSSTTLATTVTEAESEEKSSLPLPNNDTSSSASKPNTDGYTFFWPEIGRGEIILSEADYKTANDILLEQDFETEELAMAGTMSWIHKVSSLADVLWWGIKVTGKNEVLEEASQSATPVQTISTGLIVRKRKKDVQGTENIISSTDKPEAEGETSRHANSEGAIEATSAVKVSNEMGVNVLNASLIKKKKKT